MTDTPPKPKRRRWMVVFVVVITLICFAGLKLWRSIPSGYDERFVGRWAIATEPGLEIVYRKGGLFQYFRDGKPRNQTIVHLFRWFAHKGVLYHVYRSDTPADSIWERVKFQFALQTDGRPEAVSTYQINLLEADEIILQEKVFGRVKERVLHRVIE